MAELIIAEKQNLVDIADAIRAKTETTDTLNLEEMAQMITGIETGANLEEITVEQATPSISVSSDGLITASATQTEGYVIAGTKSTTQQLTAVPGLTITPSTEEQLAVAAGMYTLGDIKVAAVPADLTFKAYIKVTYPKGICTCTLGDDTQTHSGGGEATFVVRTEGNYLITATYNSISKSNTVSIVTNGETKTVSISYTTYLYNAGDTCTSVTGGWNATAKKMSSDCNTTGAQITCNKNSDNIYFTNAGGTGAILTCQNKIDLTDIKTIKFEGTMADTSDAPSVYMKFCIWSSLGTYWHSNIVAQKAGNNTGFSLDVSSLTGSYYIGFGIYAFGWEKITMKKLYLEV